MDDKKTIRIRAVLDIPVTEEELWDLVTKSNGEGELDVIGMGYSEIQLTSEQVREYLTRDYVISNDEKDPSWIADEDLEVHDDWFLKKKQEKYGRKDQFLL